MIPYYTLPVMAFVVALIRIYGKRCTPLVAILLLTCLAVGMLRGTGLGTDYYNYQSLFSHAPESIEPGFLWLMQAVKMLGGGFHALLALVFALAFFTKWWTCQRMSLHPYLSLMLCLGFWFLTYDLNGIRQGLALGLIGVATYHVWQRHTLLYWVFALLAASVHYSALVYLPFIFFVGRQCTKRTLMLFAALCAGFLAFNAVEVILGYFGGSELLVLDKIESYGQNELYNENVLYSFSTVHRILVTILIVYAVSRMKIDDRLKSIFLWAALFSMAIYLMFGRIEIVATRLSLNYRFIECFTLGCLPSLFVRRSNRTIVAFLLLVYMLMQVYTVLSIPDGGLVPYRFL